MKKIHFIGIAGSGMSSLAYCMVRLGSSVSGSDSSNVLDECLIDFLKNNGVVFYNYHSELLVKDVDIVVYSAAIKDDNIEYKYAKKNNSRIILISRSELLGYLASYYSDSIAICGTHGKTTITSLIGKIFLNSSLNPTLLIGSFAPYIKSNVYYGGSSYFIYEACEAYGSFFNYRANNLLISNIACDHMEYFKSVDNLISYFSVFIHKILLKNGFLFINLDDKYSYYIYNIFYKQFKHNIKSYALYSQEATFKAINIKYNSDGTEFDIEFDGNLYRISSPLYGEHNVYNLLAAYSLSSVIPRLNHFNIVESIKNFKNSSRRLEKLYADKNKDIIVYSDYAHHPVELQSTIKAINQINQVKLMKLCVIFQPHLLSRTRLFFYEYAKSLICVDRIFLLPIYLARESSDNSINSSIIFNAIKKLNSNANVLLFETNLDFLSDMKLIVKKNTIFLFAGAGDIDSVSKEFVNFLQNYN